jgi:CHAT domain-containing protein
MKYLFFLILVYTFSFSLEGQSFLPPLTKDNFVAQTNKLADAIRRESTVSGRLRLSLELAHAYNEFGQFHRAIALGKALDTLDEKTKDRYAPQMAELYYVMAMAYERLIIEQPMLIEAKKMRKYYQKAYPDKEIYEALYFAFLSRYYGMGMANRTGQKYSEKSLQIFHRNRADEHLIPIHYIYMVQAFSYRNVANINYDDNKKYADTVLYYLDKHNITNTFEKNYAIVGAFMYLLDRSAYYDANLPELLDSTRYYAFQMDEILLKSIREMEDMFGPYHPHIARFEFLRGILYLYIQDYDKAIALQNQAIKYLTLDGQVEHGTFSTFNLLLANAYSLKARVLENKYEETPEIRYLKQIDSTLLKLEQVWLTYAEDRFTDSKSFGFNHYLIPPYIYFQKNSLRLYQRTQDEAYLARYYHYSELSRHFTLLYNLQKKISGIKLQDNAPAYEKLELILAERSAGTGPSPEEIMKMVLRKNAPINLNILSYAERRQALQSHQAIVYMADLPFARDKNFAIHIIEKERDTVVLMNLDIFNMSIYLFKQDIGLIRSVKENNLDSFKIHSHYIYQQVMQPVRSFLSKDITDLIIHKSPFFDNASIPFELLTTEHSPKGNYKDLNYLGQQYNISYSQTQIKDTNPPKRLTSRAQPLTVFIAEHSELPPLLYKKQFLDNLRARYEVRIYEGKQSTRAALINVLEHDPLVLVVAHGVGNRSEHTDEKGIYLFDGFLTVNEITELNCRTELLVLAGCSTSIGYRTNEGNINLPRAFTMAGVKSMLVSSWDIDERSSLMLIEFWLQYLHEGFSKPEALRRAQGDFLQMATARLSAPLYWGAFSVIGDERPIRIRGKSYLPQVAGGIALLVFMLLVFNSSASRKRYL